MSLHRLIGGGQRAAIGASLLTWTVLIPTALMAGTIGGTVVIGSVVIPVPICDCYFSAVQTVPILTVAALLGILSRAAFSWHETDWRSFSVYVVGALPSAILGAPIFIEIDAALIHRLLGLFILLMIAASRLMARFALKVMPRLLFPIGAARGLLSGVVGAVGPINAPFFLGYGLVKGAYLATEGWAPPRSTQRNPSCTAGSPLLSVFLLRPD
jgi:uncharacterized membrane protein YfcA